MYSNDMEKALDDFLQRSEYDEAENALYAIVRAAFFAGVQAAGGEMPQEERIFTVLPPLDKDGGSGILE